MATTPTARPAPLPGVRVEDVAAALDPAALLVHYTPTENGLVVTTVDRERADVVLVPGSRVDLLGVAARVQRAWSRGLPSRPDDAVALTEALLAPLQDRLEEHPRLVVVPAGSLHTIPFAALELGGSPLVDRWAVSQLPAAALVPRLAGRPGVRAARGSVVVGDPVATNPLPGARVEAVTVARLLGTRALVGADADEPSVRRAMAAAGGITHLATHGHLDEQAPDLSALALAGGDELTVAELVGMGLDTDLAVLSACDSGRGEVTQGGDVVGLARGLLAAGARHAVVTLWPVDDQVACLVMVRFVERVLTGEGVAEALAGAQREVRRTSEAERGERFRALADAAVIPDDTTAGSRRRVARDVHPPTTAVADPRHPSWWAPFVHVGV
jgi:CHAT domain-containing protein